MQMTQEELTQLMIDSAQNAIETTKQEFGVILDETEQSLSLVDDVILSWLGKYESQALEDNAVFTYAFAGICYQRLVNDSQISVKNYFDHAVANNVQ